MNKNQPLEINIKGIIFVVYQRSEDYAAYIKGMPGIWECGKSQSEALGRVIILANTQEIDWEDSESNDH